MGESSGVPVPGETALITGAVLASRGKLQIELVIALAAAGAIVGDNIGYRDRPQGRALAARAARALLTASAMQVLETGEPFFERHGPKAVFFGRFVLGLRVWASWLAGATRMHWRSFVLWNACGGICWATAIGLLAYFLGHSAGNVIETFGLYGLAAAAAGDRRRRSSRTAATAAARYARRRPPRDAGASGHERRAPRAARLAASNGAGSSRPLQGAMRSHMSASTLSSPSEKREKKCSLTTARCVTRASSSRSRPVSVRHA